MAKKGQEPDLEATTSTEAPVVAPKKKAGGPIVYIAIAVAMMVVGYFGGTKFLGKADSGHGEETAKEEKQEGTESDSPEKTEMVMIDDIIVNPAGTGGTRFLSCSIGFEISSEGTAADFESRRPMIRDALITILGSKSLEQLSDAKEKEITRFQIKKRVEQLLHSKDLHGVYFTDFVLQ